ncbi:MAG: glycosyltransferase family 4 protein, partial [Bacteroidia bacterium]|nr:glycosyltransferase family 4 protein [Bacteroidia bacterium]
MIIAVNTRLFIPNKLEGVGWFSYEVVKRIVLNHPEHQFVFLFDRPYSNEYIFSNNVIPVVVSPPARHPILWYLWFNYGVTRALKKYKADLFFSPDGFLSLRTKCKQIGITHDLNFEHYPNDLPFIHRYFFRTYFKKFVRIAHKIGTVSQFSKNDIAETYQIDKNKISVVYNGVNVAFKPINETEKEKIRNKYSQGVPYFIFIGALHQRKNIARLIKAFDIFKKKTNSTYKLVLAGNKKWWTTEMENAFQTTNYKTDIIFTGRILQEDLINLLATAYSLVYVPYFEGFGIPILEGMSAGTSVITSNVTSMPEVAGDCAVLVDPFNEKSIAEGMEK